MGYLVHKRKFSKLQYKEGFLEVLQSLRQQLVEDYSEEERQRSQQLVAVFLEAHQRHRWDLVKLNKRQEAVGCLGVRVLHQHRALGYLEGELIPQLILLQLEVDSLGEASRQMQEEAYLDKSQRLQVQHCLLIQAQLQVALQIHLRNQVALTCLPAA